uniref:Uncharacterized protein n=1 Tax=Ralstonia solanacearum TaxID=305 RepID=A0A0S4VP14_RALSL|nr:conserved protein of unknown function [Ralstonia solanacearum]CUV61939.1 conserved protein of unknown function [Ralstonia solanacearum]
MPWQPICARWTTASSAAVRCAAGRRHDRGGCFPRLAAAFYLLIGSTRSGPLMLRRACFHDAMHIVQSFVPQGFVRRVLQCRGVRRGAFV